MRKLFAQFIGSTHHPDRVNRLLELQAKHENYNNPSTSSVTTIKSPKIMINDEQGMVTHAKIPIKVEQPIVSTAPTRKMNTQLIEVIDRVRKWGIRYDGGKDPFTFIERVEEMYGVDKNLLPNAMPELCKDRALIWFRNNNKHWETWESFKSEFLAFFLPGRYFEKLEDDIRRSCQRPREMFKDYFIALQNLMRHSDMTDTQKLERIYRNAHPNYLWYIRDFSNLSDLLALADDLEGIPNVTNQFNRSVLNTTVYSPR